MLLKDYECLEYIKCKQTRMIKKLKIQKQVEIEFNSAIRKQGIRFWDKRTFCLEIIYKSLIPTFGSCQNVLSSQNLIPIVCLIFVALLNSATYIHYTDLRVILYTTYIHTYVHVHFHIA